MSGILGILASKWAVTLAGAIALALVVWFLGPLVGVAEFHPLESDVARIIAVVAILILWAVFILVSRLIAARKNAAMVETLTEAPAGGAPAGAAEVSLLRARIEEALDVLKRSGSAQGRRYLYQLPWYMLIGPPGSGKTTALRNSGLKFPLAERHGKEPVRGVGGTRNCDWWFTDEAVLLDTAGRYTTQDSDAQADQGAWLGFLRLLREFRPRQPINGALVAISIGDIAAGSAAQRAAHAAAVRQRLKELTDEFGVRPPVYVLFTKADLVAGFAEFFDDLSREDREQVWGVTFPLQDRAPDAPPVVAAFAGEFDALGARLNARLFDRIQQETDLGRRALIYGFPTQVASLKEPLQEFLGEVFMPNRYEGRPLLRGVYFTSGTQEGTPIDRLMSTIAASFGLDRQRLPAFSGTGRSYFLTRLLSGVIFAEASLAGANHRLERRQRLLRVGAYAAAAAMVLIAVAAWTTSYFGNRALIAAEDAGIDAYAKAAAPVAATQVADGDLTRALPALQLARTLPAGYDTLKERAPLRLGFGLYQGDKLATQAAATYQRALDDLFLPRLLVRLGDQIRGNLARPDYVAEALKVYLMLGAQGPLDKDLVRTWMDIDWKSAFPGDGKAPLRQELGDHLEALLATPLPAIALDANVLEPARRALLQVPPASRAYNEVKQSAAARQLPEWRISDHAGPAADRIFVRASGRPLAEGIPGLYTREGFYKVLLPAAASAARDVAAERWVLGPDAPNEQVSANLQQDVIQLYVNDYIARWDGLLSDLAIVPFRGMQQAAEATNILSGPDSPLKLILSAAAQETLLAHPPAGPAGAAGSAAAKPMPAAANGAEGKLAGLVGQASAAEAPTYGHAVEDHFRRLQEFVGADGRSPAPVDDVGRGLNTLYLALNRVAQPGQDASQKGGPASGAAQSLLADSSHLPAPADRLVAAVARNVTTLAVGGARSQLNDDWQARVLPFCHKALDNRYPVFAGSKSDVTLDDFTKLFGPNGLIDGFFTTNLKPYVDMSRTPWRWQKLDGVDLGISADVLVEFQRAAAIRDAFFPGAGGNPALKFQLVPVSLDPAATQVVLQINGQDLSYAHGPQRAGLVQWPGTGAGRDARLALSPAATQPSSLTTSGSWAFFRLLDAAQIEPTGDAARVHATWTVGGRKVSYDVEAGSVLNPLTLRELREFRCPSRL